MKEKVKEKIKLKINKLFLCATLNLFYLFYFIDIKIK